MEGPQYPCSQSDLIVVINTGIATCLEYLAELFGFSERYTETYFNDFKTEVNVAAEIPDEPARRAVSEMKRLELVAKNRECCKLWQRLKRYISKIYAGEALKLQLSSAGQDSYTQAYRETWPKSRALMVSAKKYVKANLAALTANSNMPGDFNKLLEDSFTALDTLITEYEQSKENIPVGTQYKVTELNKVYRKFMDVMLDGQEIFKEDEAVYKQFVFAEILSRVGGNGLAGIRGTITNSTTEAPIGNARISLNGLADFAISEANGTYLFNCPSGKYDVNIQAEGFVSRIIQKFTIDVGTVSKLDVSLSPEPPKEE